MDEPPINYFFINHFQAILLFFNLFDLFMLKLLVLYFYYASKSYSCVKTALNLECGNMFFSSLFERTFSMSEYDDFIILLIEGSKVKKFACCLMQLIY